MTQPTFKMPWAFLDQLNGSDSNSGTQLNPMATLGQLAARYTRAPVTVFVKAPVGAPYIGVTSFARTYPIILRPWGAGPWYLQGDGTAYALRYLLGAGAATVTHEIHGAHIVSPGSTGVRLGDTAQAGGSLDIFDSYIEGATQGAQTVDSTGLFRAWRSEAKGITNDGWNFHGTGHGELYDCAAPECGDESVSPHDDYVLDLFGFEGADSSGGGMNAVGNAVCNMHISPDTGRRCVFERNGAGHAGLYGGIGYYDNASGIIDGATTSDNYGPGFQNTGVGVVTKTDLVSSGNALPDVN